MATPIGLNDAIAITDEEKASYQWGGQRARPRKKIERVMKTDATYLKPPGSCMTKWPTLGISVDIECCERCNIYVLDPCEQVQISECIGCRIVVGPCVGSVMIFDCVDCTIAVAAKQVRLRDCSGCELRTFVPLEDGAVAIETSKDLKFGAWDVAYPGLAKQLVDRPLTGPEADVPDFFKRFAASLPANERTQFWAARACTANHWDKIFDFSPAADGAAPNWTKVPGVDPKGRWCELTLAPEGLSGGSVVETRGATPSVKGCDCPCQAQDGTLYTAAWYNSATAVARVRAMAALAADADATKAALEESSKPAPPTGPMTSLMTAPTVLFGLFLGMVGGGLRLLGNLFKRLAPAPAHASNGAS